MGTISVSNALSVAAVEKACFTCFVRFGFGVVDGARSVPFEGHIFQPELRRRRPCGRQLLGDGHVHGTFVREPPVPKTTVSGKVEIRQLA